jgi:hypothetical protein
MDEVGAELRGYKLISSIYPQGRLGADAQALVFTVGPPVITRTNDQLGGLRPSTKPITSSTTTWRGDTWPSRSNKADFLPFSLNGYDFDVTLLGRF